MDRKIIGFFLLGLLLLISAPLSAEEGDDGFLIGGPSDNFQTPTLDLQRSYYGTYEKAPAAKPARTVREAQPLAPVIKDVPTVAEVEAAKAVAIAQTAMQTSKKAEETANSAKGESAQSKATSEKAIAAANDSITKANDSIDRVNRSVDRVNEINKNLMEEIARLRFETGQKDQQLEKDMSGLKEEMSKMTIKGTAEKESAARSSTYLVKKGDFLSKISGKKDIYGEAGAWKKIYQANRNKIKNPNLIFPGQELVIPK